MSNTKKVRTPGRPLRIHGRCSGVSGKHKPLWIPTGLICAVCRKERIAK